MPDGIFKLYVVMVGTICFVVLAVVFELGRLSVQYNWHLPRLVW